MKGQETRGVCTRIAILRFVPCCRVTPHSVMLGVVLGWDLSSPSLPMIEYVPVGVNVFSVVIVGNGFGLGVGIDVGGPHR